MGSDGIMQFISQSLYLLPMLLVGVFGILLLFTLPVPARVRVYGIAGLALLLVNSLGGVAFFSWYAHAMSEGGGSQLAPMMGFVRLLTSVLHAAAVALLVAAALTGRGTKSPV